MSFPKERYSAMKGEACQFGEVINTLSVLNSVCEIAERF